MGSLAAMKYRQPGKHPHLSVMLILTIHDCQRIALEISTHHEDNYGVAAYLNS